MAKRGRVECSRKAYKFRDKKGSSIDMLPDELLVLILSSLPLKEAVATSILSRRWRYLWTFITKLDFDGTLHFDGTLSMLKMMASGKIILLVYNEKARLNCVEWVNHVIALHKSPNIEEFRVFFDLTKSYKSSIDECTIDEWLRFALARKVERLELHLTAEDFYTFDPYNLLKRKFSDSIDHVKYLKKIFLNHVNVNDKALEFFLRRCPLLEHLSVSQSIGLSSLKIIRSFPSFKRLEINYCYNLKSIEIRNANLVYLKYRGYKVHFVVENLPQLVEMSIGGRCGGRGMEWDVGDVFRLFSNYIPQLEILTLDFFWGYNYNKLESLCSDVKMSNLKQLIVKVVIVGDDSLMPLANLVHASPCLQRFVLVHASPCWESFVLVHSLPRLKRYVHKATWPEWLLFIERKARKTERSYPQLKEIEFVGYQGMVSELELFEHFLDNAVALDKIRVDTFKTNGLRFLDDIYFASKVNEAEISARSRAKKQLSMKVPPKINLEII